MSNSTSCGDGKWCALSDALFGVTGIHITAVSEAASGLIVHV
ncbi:hypothetical protein AAFM46_11920 [Arthrobacter sp. TMP15]